MLRRLASWKVTIALYLAFLYKFLQILLYDIKLIFLKNTYILYLKIVSFFNCVDDICQAKISSYSLYIATTRRPTLLKVAGNRKSILLTALFQGL